MIQLIISFVHKIISLVWFYRETDGRYIHLQQAFEGLMRANVPFVEYANGIFYPFCAVDDIGIYWLIPRIALFFNCSLITATKLFMYGLPLFSFLNALVALFLIYRTVAQRFVVLVGLSALFSLTLYLGDVYIVYSSIVLVLIPWAIYLTMKPAKSLTFAVYGIVAGLLIGFVHYFRGYAGLAPFLFIFFLIGLDKAISHTNKKHIAYSFLIGFFISNLIIFEQQCRYQKYSEIHFNNVSLAQYNHPIWHMIYIGLGFLKFGNIENIRFQDNCAGNFLDKKRSEHPELSAVSDEIILRNEVLRICKEQNYFVIFTLFGKIGVLLLLLFCAANLGLLATFFYPKSLILEMSFAIAAAISAAFPVLTMPFLTYSLEFIAFCVLYGIVSINYALTHIKFPGIDIGRIVRRKERAI